MVVDGYLGHWAYAYFFACLHCSAVATMNWMQTAMGLRKLFNQRKTNESRSVCIDRYSQNFIVAQRLEHVLHILLSTLKAVNIWERGREKLHITMNIRARCKTLSSELVNCFMEFLFIFSTASPSLSFSVRHYALHTHCCCCI